MTIYKRIVQVAGPAESIPPTRGINTYIISNSPSQSVVVMWCSDNSNLLPADQMSEDKLATSAAAAGKVLDSHPSAPPSGTFKLIGSDRTVLESG